MVCSLLSALDTVCSFLSLSQKYDWPYALGALWTTMHCCICISNLPGISLFVKFSNKLVDTV